MSTIIVIKCDKTLSDYQKRDVKMEIVAAFSKSPVERGHFSMQITDEEATKPTEYIVVTNPEGQSRYVQVPHGM